MYLEKIREEERYDGIIIVTSELDMPDFEVIDTYRELWRIEESFRVTKRTETSRFMHQGGSFEAHFLTYLTALLILVLRLELKGNTLLLLLLMNLSKLLGLI